MTRKTPAWRLRPGDVVAVDGHTLAVTHVDQLGPGLVRLWGHLEQGVPTSMTTAADKKLTIARRSR